MFIYVFSLLGFQWSPIVCPRRPSHSPTACLTVSPLAVLQLAQTYSRIRGSILAGQYQPVSAFACGEAAVTSYTAADLPTKSQFSEAAFAANQAVAGRLAALHSQVCHLSQFRLASTCLLYMLWCVGPAVPGMPCSPSTPCSPRYALQSQVCPAVPGMPTASNANLLGPA